MGSYPDADKFDDLINAATNGKYSFKDICGGTPRSSPHRENPSAMDLDLPGTEEGSMHNGPHALSPKKIIIIDEGQVMNCCQTELLDTYYSKSTDRSSLASTSATTYILVAGRECSRSQKLGLGTNVKDMCFDTLFRMFYSKSPML